MSGPLGSGALELAAWVTIAAASPGPDAEIDVDPTARLVTGFETLVRGVLRQVPLILLAAVVLVLAFLLARVVRTILRRTLLRTTDRSESFANVISGIVRSLVLALGALVALIVAVPGVSAGSVVGALGISSVAIGFAFKDILQNTLAGLLLLFRQPFEVGDEIEVAGHQGEVEAITVRETRLRTFEGERVLIANQDVYSLAVVVQTAYDRRRQSIVVGIDYEADLAEARRIALFALTAVEGVLAAPAPEAYYTEMNVSTVDLDLRFWTRPQQAVERRVRNLAIEAVTNALNAAEVALPADVVEVDLRAGAREALDRIAQAREG